MSSKTAYLIDGHHVFLETLTQIQQFVTLLRKPSILDELPHSRFVSQKYFTTTSNDPVTTFEAALSAIDYADIALSDLLYPGFGTMPVQGELELHWFDAKLPPIEEAQTNARWKEASKNWLNLLSNNKYEFSRGRETASLSVSYDLKNQFIEEVEKWGFPGHIADPILGWREFRSDRGKFYIAPKKLSILTLQFVPAILQYDQIFPLYA